jgi:PAS domain S-box-containing protein
MPATDDTLALSQTDQAAWPADAPVPPVRALWIAFICAAAALLFAWFAAYFAANREVALNLQTDRSYRINEALDALGASLSGGEMASPDRVRHNFAVLRGLVAAEPPLADDIARLESASNAVFGANPPPVAGVASAPASQSPAVPSYAALSSLRARIRSIAADARALAAARDTQARRYARLQLAAIACGAGAALCALLIAALLVARTLHLMRLMVASGAQRRGELARLNQRLEEQLAERSRAAAENAAALAEARKRLHLESGILAAVFDSSHDALIVCDVHLRPLRANPAATRMFGAEIAELQPIDRLAETIEIVRANGGEPLPLAEWPAKRALHGETVEMQCLVRRRGHEDGAWIACVVRPLRNDRGVIQGIVAVARNLAVERRADALDALLGALMGAAAVAIIAVDAQGRIYAWNSAAERMFGYAADDVTGREPSFLTPADRVEEEKELLARAARGEMTVEVETVRQASDGRIIEVALAVARIAGSGAVMIFQNLAERNRIRAELAKAQAEMLAEMRQRADFMAGVSREIRTPLNGVIGMTELLSNAGLSPDQRDLARTISASGGMLMRIVDDMLEYSRLVSGKLALNLVDFDLYEILGAAAEGIAERAAALGLEIAVAIAPGAPRSLRGDPERLRKILDRLLNHALKFAERGDLVITAAPAAGPGGPGPHLRFEVRSTSVKLAAPSADDPFRPFARIRSIDGRDLGDAGLGLSVAAHLVEAMGGRLECGAAADGGSRFSFALAFEPGENRSSDAADFHALRGIAAVIVDDDAAVRSALLSCLNGWGVDAHAVVGREEALALMREQVAAGAPCDLVLADSRLSDVDGAALARAIKADARLRAARVLLMTPAGEAASAVGGADGCLRKPINPARLFERLVEIARVLHAPAAKSAANAEGKVRPIRPPSDTPEQAPAATAKILVIEDNPVNRKIMLLQLRNLGYAGDAAENASAGLDALAVADYAAVLLNCELPDLDGYAVASEIRRRESGSRKTVIIAMTARPMTDVREKCLAAGMDDFLIKPVTLESLGVILERWLVPAPDLAEAETALPMHDERASLNEEVIAELRDLASATERDPVGELASLFERDIDARIKAMRDALARGDGEALMRAAHSLRGSAGGLGLERLSALAGELEARALRREFRAAAQYLAELRRETERVLPLLERERSRQSAAIQA